MCAVRREEEDGRKDATRHAPKLLSTSVRKSFEFPQKLCIFGPNGSNIHHAKSRQIERSSSVRKRCASATPTPEGTAFAVDFGGSRSSRHNRVIRRVDTMPGIIGMLLVVVLYPVALLKLQEIDNGKLQVSHAANVSNGVAALVAINTVWALWQLLRVGSRGRERMALPSGTSLALFALFSPLHIPTVVLRQRAANYIQLNDTEVTLKFLCHVPNHAVISAFWAADKAWG
jgi:hypothetical protein